MKLLGYKAHRATVEAFSILERIDVGETSTLFLHSRAILRCVKRHRPIGGCFLRCCCRFTSHRGKSPFATPILLVNRPGLRKAPFPNRVSPSPQALLPQPAPHPPTALHTTSLQKRRNSQISHFPRCTGGAGMCSVLMMALIPVSAALTCARNSAVNATSRARRAGMK